MDNAKLHLIVEQLRKLKSGQLELRQEISAFQDKINAGQAQFEEMMTYTLDTQLKSIMARGEQQAQDLRDETWNLRVDFNKEINAAQQNFQTQLEMVKAAAWLPARLREVTRGPVGMSPTPSECHRDGRQVCKRCGKPGHL
jgi:chromosome segregation ATPase